MEEKHKNGEVHNLGRQETKSLKVREITSLIHNYYTNNPSYKKVHQFKQAVWNFDQRKASSTNPGQIKHSPKEALDYLNFGPTAILVFL